jgi:hypothetical protein
VRTPRKATSGQRRGSSARKPPCPRVSTSTGTSANRATVKAIWNTEKRALASLIMASPVENEA